MARDVPPDGSRRGRAIEALYPDGEPPILLSSLTRIADFGGPTPTFPALSRGDWATGDYVVVEVTGARAHASLELSSGRIVDIGEGDRLIGALGSRFATLEVTGSWEDADEEGRMHLISGGGLIGAARSVSTLVAWPASVRYRGHVEVDGQRATMRSAARGRRTSGAGELGPVILLIGTSMSAGKTTAARIIIGRLRAMGLRVQGAKVAGAGRYRDILAMRDAGADPILDFVDVGLPSTHCPREAFEEPLDELVARLASADVDVTVVEAGASPLEPYNGDVAVERLRDDVVFTVLCASDPYAVVGALEAYSVRPDLVTGTTSNTEAGVALAERLSGLPVLDVRRRDTHARLDQLLRERLGR